MRKSGLVSIALTLIGAVIIALNLSSVFDVSLMMSFFLIWVAVWFILSLTGVVILSRKGYFPVEKLRGNEAFGCIIFLVFWWLIFIIIAIPGPYLLWYADTKKRKPQCPSCKRWLPPGVVVCPACGSRIINGEDAK